MACECVCVSVFVWGWVGRRGLLIILMEAHPLWVAAFRVWVVNCVSIERGLDTKEAWMR